jgi:cytidylate kinase
VPIVTISRMYGSGGSVVAGRVAAALGWALLDNQLVDAVAERLGMTRDDVAAREERVPSLVQRLADAMALGSPELQPTAVGEAFPPTEERLIEMTVRVIDEAVVQGPVVVVGRGAQAALAARADAFHVFCYAPRSALVEAAAARHKVGVAEAERIVEEVNRQREQYARRYWNRAWRAQENYHLCVNTAWLGLDRAAALIVEVARERFGAAV